MSPYAATMAGLAPTLAIIASYILSRSDNRKAARKVAVQVAGVASTVADNAVAADTKLDGIHILVNSRLTEALDRISALELKLGLEPGEEIPQGSGPEAA